MRRGVQRKKVSTIIFYYNKQVWHYGWRKGWKIFTSDSPDEKGIEIFCASSKPLLKKYEPKTVLKKNTFVRIFCLVHLGINSLKGGKNNRKTPQIALIYGVFLKNSLFVLFTWRKERDSNPRCVAAYLISSQGRYDHFDIFP